jgi:hypothetical protein
MEVFSEMKLLSGLLAKEMSMPGGVVFEEQHVYLIEDVRRLLSDSRSGHIMERAMGAYSMRSSPPFVHLDLIRDAIFSAAGIPIGSESGLIAGVTVSDSFARIEPFWKSTERFSEHITHRTVSAKAMKVFVDGVSEAVSSTLDYV